MKKKNIVILLIIGCIIIVLTLQLFELNLRMRTIVVTLLIAFLFSIRAVIAMYDDKTDSHKK